MTIEKVHDDYGIVIGYQINDSEIVWRDQNEVNADAAELAVSDVVLADKLKEEYGLDRRDIEAAKIRLRSGTKARANLKYTASTTVYDYDQESGDYSDDESHVDHGDYIDLEQALYVANSIEQAMALVEAKDKVFFTQVVCGGEVVWESTEHGTSTAGARKPLPKTKGSADHV